MLEPQLFMWVLGVLMLVWQALGLHGLLRRQFFPSNESIWKGYAILLVLCLDWKADRMWSSFPREIKQGGLLKSKM